MISTARRRSARRPWLQLLSAVLELAGSKAELLRHSERAWTSVTFSGTRHLIALSFAGNEAIEAGEDFIAALPEHEFGISGQIVADATITAVHHEALPEERMTVEAELLLVEDA
ncbi:MAG: hypothetical protein KDE55_13035 [Novosphingobium sp.]|nr:hypothetical protein [Novosphingobium sp.]